MNIIPKINVGKASHRNKFDLSCMCHTTSEVGYMQPMFSKLLSPHTNLKIGTRSLVRLSSLFVPTMGKLDLRFYHAFVPLNTIWTPFDAFITGTDFTLADGSQYRPTAVPKFALNEVFEYLSKNSMIGESPNLLYHSAIDLTRYTQQIARYSEMVQYWFDTSDSNYNPKYLFDQRYNPKCKMRYYGKDNGFIIADDRGYEEETDFTPELFLYCYYDESDNSVHYMPYESANEFKVDTALDKAYGPIPSDNPDWVLTLYEPTALNGVKSSFSAKSLFSVRMRRLRKAFIGLGYAFNPFDDTFVTPFKLMAYYKAWYQIFYPQRESNFYATSCYKLTKYLSENGVTLIADMGSNRPETKAMELFASLLDDLCDVRYILPLDYFSLADPQAETRGASTGSTSSDSGSFDMYVAHGAANIPSDIQREAVGATAASSNWNGNIPPYEVNNSVDNTITALGIRTAMKLMRFINKNTVIGKKVSDILRMRYGVVDSHEQSHEKVYFVGSSKVDVSISDVMCTSPTDDMQLGDFAGKGIGFGDSKYFTFDTGADTGIFVTFAAIVPMVGYYQGMLRENTLGINDRFDFFSPEFDALGYDDVKYNELVADLMQQDYFDLGNVGTNLGSIGYVPRYTSLKVTKDICNGDISLHSREDSMLPYTLDRRFKSLPDMTPENFRSLNITDFNRIFNSKSSWDDHFIIQTNFDISMWADMKSLANAFDTFDDDGDTDTISMEHQ